MEIFEQTRATGRTTRLADEAIQAYFSLKPGEKMAIVDHCNNSADNGVLARIIALRLKQEHHIDVEIQHNAKLGTFIARK